MGRSLAQKQEYLKLIFWNEDMSNMGDAAGIQGSAASGKLYIALHTADPTEDDIIATETSYLGYERFGVYRQSGQWDLSGEVMRMRNNALFPANGGPQITITHISVRKELTGGDMVGYTEIDTPLTLPSGRRPEIGSNDLFIREL